MAEPEKRAERLANYINNQNVYLESIEQQKYNREAETDITLLLSGKTPPQREEYTPEYLEYFNRFMMGNRYLDLDPELQERIKLYVSMVGLLAARTANLEATQEDAVAIDQQEEQEEQIPPGVI